MQFTKRIIRKGYSDIKGFMEEGKFRRISSHYNLHGKKRVYFIHIRKAGGTSLNRMFLALSGEDSRVL